MPIKKKKYVLGISGASGIVLAVKLLKELTALGHFVDVIMSSSAKKTLHYEMQTSNLLSLIPKEFHCRIQMHGILCIESPLASGSYAVDGTIILPCSMATLAAISIGLGDNLLRRVADVALKERRLLILSPREAPLHAIHLQNMLKVTELGAVIYPALPMWYLQPQTIDQLENDIVGRILDVLKEESRLTRRWQLPSVSKQH